MKIKHKKIGSQHILYHDSLDTKAQSALFNLSVFNPDHLLTANCVYREASGRGRTYFFNQDEKHWVLRHYWRGGIIGKIFNDRYWWLSLKATRAYQELSLLNTLQSLQLPSPIPIAARITKHGLFYQADIITQAIDNNQSLVQRLKQPVDKTLWQNIGRTIARFHSNGIYHDDLNAHNILISERNEVSLIDFDKGKVIKNSQQWMRKNLARLHRSLAKESTKGTINHFNTSNWSALMDGYENEN
jgi:3-deoxy-D-manno-octulosonic acid kinase